MRHALVNIGWNKLKVIPIHEENWNKVFPYLCYKYSMATEIQPPPEKCIMDIWKQLGVARALCGCWVVGQARCAAHNKMSWLTAVYNLV